MVTIKFVNNGYGSYAIRLFSYLFIMFFRIKGLIKIILIFSLDVKDVQILEGSSVEDSRD